MQLCKAAGDYDGARAIEKVTGEEVVATNPHGTNQHTSGLDISNPQSGQGGTSRDYTIARLKASGFPLLAQQIADGEISAAEARRQAGYDVRKVAVRMDDPASAARTIPKNMQREQVDELI